jgi:hypothetical protein
MVHLDRPELNVGGFAGGENLIPVHRAISGNDMRILAAWSHILEMDEWRPRTQLPYKLGRVLTGKAHPTEIDLKLHE